MLLLLVNNVNKRLGGLRFYEDSNGKWVVGADSVPKKLGEDINVLDDIIGNGGIIELGTRNSKNAITTPYEINISQYWNYRALNAENFVVEVLDMQFCVYHNPSSIIEQQTEYYVNGAGVYMLKPSVTYNANTGVIQIIPQRGTYNDGTYDRECNLDANEVSYFKAKIYLKS